MFSPVLSQEAERASITPDEPSGAVAGEGRVVSPAMRLLERSTEPFAMLDATGVFTAVNDAFVARTGLSADLLVGRPLDDRWTIDAEPGQPDSLPELLARVWHEAAVRVDARLAPRGAIDLVVGLHLFVGGPDSIGVGLVATAAERRPPSSRSGAPVRLTIDQIVVGLVISGVDGVIEQMNEAMYRLYGRTPDDMPMSEHLLTHRDDRVAGVELGVRARGGEIDGWTREKRLIRPDGRLVWVQESVTLVRDGAGAPSHFVTQNIDLSATRRAEAALRDSEAQVTYLTDGLPVAVVEVDADGRITSGNTAPRELLGHELIDQSLATVTHPDDLARVRKAFARPLGDDSDWQLEFRVRRHDDRFRWVRANARLHVDGRGDFVKAVSTWTDITDEVEARQSSDRLGELIESVEDLVVITDLDGRVTYLNGTGKSLLGEAAASDGGDRRLAELFADESVAEINDIALSTVRHFGAWKGEVGLVPPDQEPRVVSLSLVSHIDARGGPPSISAMARDITELKNAEVAMRHQAMTDGLTGLPNRTILFDRIDHALARATRSGGGMALLFVDLDRFKAVNDRMGHDAGDELLVQVAGRMRESVRDCDTLARIGGDEFVVLAEPVMRLDDAMVVADRIVGALARPFDLRAGAASIGASVGLAMSEPGSTARSLLDRADRAVYQAKASGRSRVMVFEE